MISYKAFVCLILGTCFIIQVQSLYRSHCECGITGNTNRIVGGWNAFSNKFPWIVPIYNKNKLYCGGSIINNRYILTAGHCVRWSQQQDIVIQTSAHDRRVKKPENMYRAEQLILHPDFYSHQLYDEHDIAIIKVDRPIAFSSTVRPVCLPERGDDFGNEFATVAGWGKLGEEKQLSPLLQETIVKVLTPQDCAKTQMKSFISPTILCAYFDKADSCQGDSGGPLVYEKEPGKMEQIGVVSWGIGCGSSTPGMYTKVSEYTDWIYDNTADGMFCKN